MNQHSHKYKGYDSAHKVRFNDKGNHEPCYAVK